MNTISVVAFLLATLTGCSKAYPQGLVMINGNADDMSDDRPPQAAPTRRPYSPLPPVHLPAYYQSLGMTLPPPPSPPLHFHEYIPSPQYQLGAPNERFFFNFLAGLKPMLFPWMRTSTTAPSPTTIPPSTDKAPEESSNTEEPQAPEGL